MERHAQALEEIKALEKPFITPAQAAKVLGCDPHYIRIMAKQHPGRLGFEAMANDKRGSRVYIPRIPFIRYVEGM